MEAKEWRRYGCVSRLRFYVPSSDSNPVRYALRGTSPRDERKRPDDEQKLVENLALGSGGRTAAARGPGLSGFGAGDRRIDWAGGCLFHSSARAEGDAFLPPGWCAVAPAPLS